MNLVAKTLVAATFAAGVASAAAAVTIVPVSAVASSSFSGYAASDAIDANPLTDWASNGEGAGSSIFFDLGGLYNLTGASITDRVTSGGGNGVFTGGTTDFTTSYALTFYSDAAGTNAVGGYNSPILAVPVAPTLPSDFLNSPLFTITAASVRYTVLISGISGNPGLSDISFEGTPSQGIVPEAGTWMLLIAGFGMVGVAARRRRLVVSA